MKKPAVKANMFGKIPSKDAPRTYVIIAPATAANALKKFKKNIRERFTPS